MDGNIRSLRRNIIALSILSKESLAGEHGKMWRCPMAEYEVVLADAKIKNAFLQVADEATYIKEIIFAKQALENNDALQKCSKESLRNALFNICLTGATLNPSLQQAFLIPRKGKVCLDFSYRGLCKIAVDSGSVYDIDATVVYEKDEFYYEMGLYPTLKHIPSIEGDPGKPRFVYAVAILHHNIKKFIVLTADEIDKIKKSSIAFTKGSDTPWKGDFEPEMWRKTAVKKIYKLLPQTEKMSIATAVLNEHEGLDRNSQEKAKEVMKRFEPEKKALDTLVACPEKQAMIPMSECEVCKSKKGCPAL
jgi:recombination protein RecT